MTTITGSSPLVGTRRLNAEVVLRRAWWAEAVTASDLIGSTGLTRSTVISLCDELIERGWLTVLPDARATGEQRAGRPARRYALASSAAHVMGVDAGRHQVTCIIADLRGRPVARLVRRVDPDGSAEARRADVSRIVDEVLAQASMGDADVLAVAIGVPAPADARGRSPREADGDFWERVNPDYAGLLSRRGWAVVVENDANLAAVAEAAVLARSSTDPAEAHRPRGSFIALLAGERFGAGFVLDGALVRGSRGAAGEMRLLDLVQGVGSADGLGAILRDGARAARTLGTLPPSSPLATAPSADLDAQAVLSAADAGDAGALAIVEDAAERFARVCAVLGGMLDVDRIVVAGAVAPSIDLLLERTREWLARFTHREAPVVVASTLGDAVVTLGAVERALTHVREHALDLSTR
ncbi:ROK family protein [Clavibacter michiganensis]|nr:ROK family protein [Clavibacter michiganensis]